MVNDASLLLKEATELREKGLGSEAAEKYYSAAQLFEKDENWAKVAECWHMAGVSWKHEQQRALKAFENALDYYQKAGDPVGKGRVLRDKAITHVYSDDLEEGLGILEESKESLRNKSVPAELAITVAKIGHVLARLGEYNKAETGFNEALRLLRTNINWFYEATTLMHFAELKLMLSKPDEAITLLWAAAGAFGNAKPELTSNQVFDHYGRRSAQLFGMLALGYLSIGNEELASSYLHRSFDYISPMEDNAAAIIVKDIRLKEIIEQFKKAAPELLAELEKHPVYKKFTV